MASAWKTSVFSHPSTLSRLEELNHLISEDPESPDYYLQRGELHRRHDRFQKALRDFKKAQVLDPDLVISDYYLARLLLDMDKPKQAWERIRTYVQKVPTDPNGFLVKARIAIARDKLDLSEISYSRVIALMPRPTPDIYIDRARVQMKQGQMGLIKADEGIDEAIKALGPLVSLIELCIEIQMAQKAFISAIDCIDRLPSKIADQPKWLARKGELFVLAKSPEKARTAFEGALMSLKSLPVNRRSTRAMVKQEKKIVNALENLQLD